jgi:CheY-like chemotaxis protein
VEAALTSVRALECAKSRCRTYESRSGTIFEKFEFRRVLIMKPRILTVGMDEPLVETRSAILRSRYEAAASTPVAALEKLRKGRYDLLLVCYSTPHEQGTALIHKARAEFPSLRIVRLLSLESPHIEKSVADKLVVVDYRAQMWVQAIDELLTLTNNPPSS